MVYSWLIYVDQIKVKLVYCKSFGQHLTITQPVLLGVTMLINKLIIAS